MAHKKAGGSAKSLRDSNPKYLGIKQGDGQEVKTGDVLVRQRGGKILAGKNVKVAKDYTLFSTQNGTVRFTQKRKTNFTGGTKKRIVISVES